ncbi:MAG TPA: hypothetical protein VMS71_04190 [Candidatus Acidoferrum sp.]|nr:hypothetical protein [Candidatus Acidoferrum sp.]
MKTLVRKLWLPGALIIGLLFAGCLLVSLTYVIVTNFSFTASSGFYTQSIDLTNNKTWDDNKDKIDLIDAVGFEMTMVNSNDEPVTFNTYVTPAGTAYTRKGQLDSLAYVIIHDLTVEHGTTVMTYAQSLTHLENLDKLKELVKGGSFVYYGTATSGGATVGGFSVNPGKIVVTFTVTK